MLGEKFGVDEETTAPSTPVWSWPFDSDRKLMSTLHDIDGVPTLFTKGAIDVLLNRSTHLLTREGKVEMTPERRESWPGQHGAVHGGPAGAGFRL